MEWLPGFFFRRQRNEKLVSHSRLVISRFRHLLRQYGEMVRLGEDAAEKQKGEYILDRQYVVTLADKCFDAAEGMIYDANALGDSRQLALYEACDRLREEVRTILARPPTRAAQAPGADEAEEPEYTLLRDVRHLLFGHDRPEETTLRDIALSAEESAIHAVFQNAAALNIPCRTTRQPGRNHVAVHTTLGRVATGELTSVAAESDPLSEFLLHYPPDGFPATVITVCSEDCMNTLHVHAEGTDLYDACLCCTSEFNHVFCRLSGSVPRMIIAEGILSGLGLTVHPGKNSVIGWAARQSRNETAAELREMGRMSAWLLLLLLNSSQFSGDGGQSVDRFFLSRRRAAREPSGARPCGY